MQETYQIDKTALSEYVALFFSGFFFFLGTELIRGVEFI